MVQSHEISVAGVVRRQRAVTSYVARMQAACDPGSLSTRQIELDEPAMQCAFALRYEVYCVECAFLERSQYPVAHESDKFDLASAHFAAFDDSHSVLGYVRLVMGGGAIGRFPFQEHCKELYPGTVLPPVGRCAEVSRMIVHADLRRRKDDAPINGAPTGSAGGRPVADDRRQDSYMVQLELYRSMFQFSRANGVRYWYAAMELPMARALSWLTDFRQIGPVTDYYGPVAPFLADLDDLESRMATNCPELLQWLRGDVDSIMAGL